LISLPILKASRPFSANEKLIIEKLNPILYRVRMGPGKLGKPWNFIVAFSRTEKFWIKGTGPGKFWKSVKLK